MESDAARFLWGKCLKSLKELESGLTASIPHEFRGIRDKLEENSSFSISTTHEFISPLYDLSDALDEWRVFMTQRRGIKKTLRKPGVVQRTKERLSHITKELNNLLNRQVPGSPSSPILDQTNWDRFTSYSPHPSEASGIRGFGKHVNEMVRWLSSSGDGFKAIGVYGMGGSGKTALVNKVLKHPRVSDEFNNIVWACLSDINCEDEIDIRILKCLLEHLGCDIDGFHGYRDDEVWLMEQLKLKLLDLKNYIVVFDDVWVCNDWFVDLCHKLGEPEKMDPKLELDGAVIVTSRKKEVAGKMVGGKKLIHVNPLDNYEENGKFLEDIVRKNMKDADNADWVKVYEVIHHCYGLPHAAKTLPGVSAEPISEENGQIS